MNIDSYKSIALFGTSADPPTTGHKALLIGLSKLFPKVVTWVSNNPSKKHKTSINQRHELLNVLVEEIGVPNLELNQRLSSQWAIETLQRANEYWPEQKLILVIGSDLITELPKWQSAKIILKQATIGIVPRQGWPINTNAIKALQNIGGKINLLPLDIPATSSSGIHDNLILSHIPEVILPILQKKNLYGILPKMQ